MPRLTTTVTTEWAVQVTDNGGMTHLVTHHIPYWGTRFQGSPVPYTQESAHREVMDTTRFATYKHVAVVKRETVTVSSDWTKETWRNQ